MLVLCAGGEIVRRPGSRVRIPLKYQPSDSPGREVRVQLGNIAVFGRLRDGLHNHGAFVDLDLHRPLLQSGLDDTKELLARLPGRRMVAAVEPDLLDGDEQRADRGRCGEYGHTSGGLPAFSQVAAEARVSASGWRKASVSAARASGVPSIPSAAIASLRTRRSSCCTAVFAYGTRAGVPISASAVTTFRATYQR